MLATALCVVAGVLGAEGGPGIEVGWKPLREGGVQYILQIDPAMIDTLRSGVAAESDIHPQVKDVRSFQIQIGKGGLLPRELPPPPAAAAKAEIPPGGQSDKPSPNKESSVLASPAPSPLKPFTPAEPVASKDPRLPLPGGFATRSPDAAPAKLPPNPETKPVKPLDHAKQMTFVGEESLQRPQLPGPSGGEEPSSKSLDTKKPWMPLTLALAGLFGSLGGNVYLGWLYWETRRRYRGVLRRKRQAERVSGSITE